ncbi:hypothetical protein [Streptomyces sp. NPDC059761]|uniref:hypothetical protein n=1 Tax=Streptomyces sp. NPDC059761 TaxID=3346937 RepID=UPI00366A45CF
MNDQQNDDPTAPVNGEAVSGETPAAAAAPRAVNRRTVALAAGAVAVAVLAGGALWGAGAIADADRSAPTRYWIAAGPTPSGTPQPVPAVPSNELTGKLMPLPVNYSLGPDLGADGNDFYVSGERAAEAFKDARSGLSGAQREQRDKALADLKLKGTAGRSYSKDHLGLVAEVRLTQADPQALAKFSEFGKKILDLVGDDREAPKVDGFPDAKCALRGLSDPERKEKEKIDTMECVAVQGDVLVSFRAYGIPQFSTTEVVDLFKQQLNRLKSPGESV